MEAATVRARNEKWGAKSLERSVPNASGEVVEKVEGEKGCARTMDRRNRSSSVKDKLKKNEKCLWR